MQAKAKIIVTVGSQMPFDRLVRTVDNWAKNHYEKIDVLAQIGDSEYVYPNIKTVQRIPKEEFLDMVMDCDLVVAHAGMGTIINCLERNIKPLVLPRKGKLRETRNDHQIDSAEAMEAEGLVEYAKDESDLCVKLDHFIQHFSNNPFDKINTRGFQYSDNHQGEISKKVKSFIETKKVFKEEEMSFDGIVCFGGEDYWYHNRGHVDMQLMREFSKTVPVIYINSIGMRMPSVGEGSVFIRRVLRKLKSISRGLRKVSKNMYVYSATTMPSIREKKIGKWFLGFQARRVINKLNFSNPLIWVACPPAEEVLNYLTIRGLVYQRTDRYEEFPRVNVEKIKSNDQNLKGQADLTFFCSETVYEDEKESCQASLYLSHGVDFDKFKHSGDHVKMMEEFSDIPKPIVGFIGGIDSHTFDPELFNRVVELCPDYSFVMVGGCSLEEGWCTAKNVYFLGRKQYDDISDYMANCDVLIMPWNKNEWIKACNPIKLKEYLAIGRPIVSSPFDELKHYEGLVYVANNAEEFKQGIENGLKEKADKDKMRSSIYEHTWERKANQILDRLETLNLKLR